MTRKEEVMQFWRENRHRNPRISEIQAPVVAKAIKWADHTMIKRGCDWLRKHSSAGDEVATIQFNSLEEMIESFKKAMEE